MPKRESQFNQDNLAIPIKYEYNLQDPSDRDEIKAFGSVIGNQTWNEYCWSKGYYVGTKEAYSLKGVKRLDKEGKEYWTADEDYQQDEIRFKHWLVLKKMRAKAKANEPEIFEEESKPTLNELPF